MGKGKDRTVQHRVGRVSRIGFQADPFPGIPSRKAAFVVQRVPSAGRFETGKQSLSKHREKDLTSWIWSSVPRSPRKIVEKGVSPYVHHGCHSVSHCRPVFPEETISWKAVPGICQWRTSPGFKHLQGCRFSCARHAGENDAFFTPWNSLSINLPPLPSSGNLRGRFLMKESPHSPSQPPEIFGCRAAAARRWRRNTPLRPWPFPGEIYYEGLPTDDGCFCQLSMAFGVILSEAWRIASPIPGTFFRQWIPDFRGEVPGGENRSPGAQDQVEIF